jgi:hypothetical protein
MNDPRYVKAKIKTQEQIAAVYPPAALWGKPLDDSHWCHGADEIVLPYLGTTVWIRKVRFDLFRFYYLIFETEIVIEPNWIAYFDEFVPPADWNDQFGEVKNDIWLEPYVDRYMMIDDLLIITG